MKIILWSFQLILFVLSLLLGYELDDTHYLIYLTIINFLISFFIVNIRRQNFINLNTFFLFGFSLFILGRFFAYLISSNFQEVILDEIYCFDFFINHCATYNEQIFLLNFINITIVGFSFPFIFSSSFAIKKTQKNIRVISRDVIILAPIVYISSFYILYTSFYKIILTVNQGYLALYASQSETYQTPVELVVYSFFISYIALLFSTVDTGKKIMVFNFKILVLVLIIILISGIFTGARTNFVTGLLLFIWLKYRNAKISMSKYLIFFIGCVALIIIMDTIAGLSGARAMGDRAKFFEQLTHTIYSQGGTVMIMNFALNLENPPALGYLKTILPGIQIFFNHFGIIDRYEFDWSSYLAYQNDSELYNAGFGLGWSLFADLYLLAGKFMPLYIIFIILWGWILKKISLSRSSYGKGLLFIFILYVFSISRASISPLIFTFFIYTFLFLLFSRRIKQKNIL